MKIVQKNKIGTQLSNTFAKSLVHPENPFTLDNPNVLINENNRMYALYIPTSGERNNYDHLLRRLFLSQLCYSTKFISILLLNSDDKVSGNGEFIFQKSFNHVSRGIDDVIDFIRRGDRTDRRWDIMQKNQFFCFKDFQVCSDVTTTIKRTLPHAQYADFSEEFSFKPQPIPTWKSLNTKTYSVKNGYSTDYGNITFKERGRYGIREAFNQLLTSRFMECFLFDDGYIYANRNKCRFSLINTEWEMFENELYPSDMTRMLNFVGFAVAQIDEIGSFERAYNTYNVSIQSLFRYSA